MSRMFGEITRTWNPITGCPHGCVYCSARGLAETRLKHMPQYQDFSRIAIVEKELHRRFTKGFIFVANQGDLWAQEHWRRPGGPATQATCFSVRERLAALQTITMMTASPHTTPLITAGAMAPPALDTDSQSKRA